MVAGTSPVRRLWATSSCSKLLMRLISAGSGPCRLLKLTSNTVSSLSNPICGGKHPVRLSFIKISSFNVFPIFPMLPGMQPPRLLFARTSTETGEFPRFSGMPNRNLLSFKNNASNSLSNSCDGTPPSNSLNRRSKNFNDGSHSTTFGNPPANRLLLTSSSKSSFNFLKLSGMTPQNLLELMWKRARSVSSPSSSGRYPAISPWLRSMPATTLAVELDNEAAQKTPP